MPVYDPTIWESEAAQEFLQAIMSLDNKSAAEAFLADILTTNEINEFLNRVKVIQERYGGLTIQFNPKFDGQKIVYQKPFNPGDENYLYLLNIVNSVGTSQLPLATVNGENDDETNKKIFLHFFSKYF